MQNINEVEVTDSSGDERNPQMTIATTMVKKMDQDQQTDETKA